MWGAIVGLLSNLLSSNKGGQDELAGGLNSLQQGVGQYGANQRSDIIDRPRIGGDSAMFGSNQNLDNETRRVMERLATKYGGGM